MIDRARAPEYGFRTLPHVMKLGVCFSFPAQLPDPADAPFDFIEGHVQNFLRPESPEREFTPVLRALQSAGRPMPAINCFLPADLKVTGPSVDRKRLARYATTAFRRARRAGIRLLVFGSAGARQLPARWAATTGFEQYVETLRLLAPIAARHRITILVEPLHRAECNLVNTVLEGAVAVARVGHPAVQLLVDFFHMLRNDEAPDDIVKVGPWIRHAHLAERAERTAPGVKGDDFRPFLRALRQAGYRGALSLECRWGDYASEIGPACTVLRRQMTDSGW